MRVLRGSTGIVLLVVYLHFVAIYLFVRGFLLSRLSLDNVAGCDEPSQCTLPATHSRAVLVIIDALRFDFISPVPPANLDTSHHLVLTLPAELTAAHPRNSFIFNAYSDPPTTTLQRIKGITTGSLPTFVELGSNFGASEIEEDSLIKQLRVHGKKLAFMGDDTWKLVFPDSFERDMTYPFDSFDVEDLHTVDNGVIENIFPLLRSPGTWDFIVGHFLGVDHVGHRLGPSHPAMKTKLLQMDKVLRDIVELLDDQTLLVVLGDHGMDRKGDHGGDGILETSSALWIYSKGVPLYSTDSDLLGNLRTYSRFPEMTKLFRSVQQIDLVPSLALLLGLPIPHNNLGAVIPELFMRELNGHLLLTNASLLNVEQINDFMQAYYSSPSGEELQPHWQDISSSYVSAIKGNERGHYLEGHYSYLRTSLATCRRLWAQFDSFLMIIGLAIMAASLVAVGGIIASSSQLRHQTERDLQEFLYHTALWGVGAGLAAAALTGFSKISIGPLRSGLAASAIAIIVVTMIHYPPSNIKPSLSLPMIIYGLHFVSFFSNSFVFWEEKIIPFFLSTLVAATILEGLSSLHHRLKSRLLGFSALLIVCVRLGSNSTICREEQQPYCTVTFYSSSSASAPPFTMMIASAFSAIFLPMAVRWFLKISKSDGGPAPAFLEAVFRVLLTIGMLCWLVEYWQSISILGPNYDSAFRQARTILSRFGVTGAAIAGPYYWGISSLCLDIVRKPPTSPGDKEQIQVFGFANAFGSSYLLLTTLLFALLYIATQITGQAVLALSLIAVLCWLEIVDTVKDLWLLKKPAVSDATKQSEQDSLIRSVTFSDTVPLALLGLQMFYGTGHQSTLQSVQWKTAFILTENLVYPFSPFTVAVNSLGPQLFVAFASLLLALWNAPPLPYAVQSITIERNALVAFLGISAYYSSLLLGSASAAALLRRHLMVWKVFAPRFMTAAATMIAVDLGGVLGVIIALTFVLRKGSQYFV